MATILVTDGEQRSALAVVRSLAAAGHRVLVAAPMQRSLAGASRRVALSIMVPDALLEPAAFASAILAAARDHQAEFVIPITEAAHLALLPLRDALLPAAIPGPTASAFARAADKEEVLRLAGGLGIDVPRQVVTESPQSSGHGGYRSLRFPVVVKPSHSVGGGPGERRKFSVRYAEDIGALETMLSGLPLAAFPVLVQERIVGTGIGLFLLRWEGRILARFVHHRLREKPPSGGVSVLSESALADASLIELAEALLRSLDWNGVAMVEFKTEAQTGRPYLMEVNGRFWGSLQLAIDSGIDFPRRLLDAALGKRSEPAVAWRVGMRSRWFWGDVDHLLLRLFKSSRALALPPGAPSRLGAVIRFFDWRPWRERDAVFRLNDVGPFLRETSSWFRAL